MVHPEGILNLSAGIFANTGTPWSILTGTDAYGDALFNTRPDGVDRNTETSPSYVDLDLRWGHDFAITPNKDEEAPRVGFSAGAFNVLNHENLTGIDPVETSSSFNVLNHVNGQGIDNVESSPEFGQVTSVAPPRRIQLAMRFQF